MKTTKELYKEKYEAQLHEWSAKLEGLKAHADKLTAEAKLEVKPYWEKLNEKRDAAMAKLEEAGNATADKWEEAKTAADHAWNDLKAAIEGAHAAIVSKTKGGGS